MFFFCSEVISEKLIPQKSCKSMTIANFASTNFDRNKKKRNVFFCQKEGSKQNPKFNKFIMKFFVIS